MHNYRYFTKNNESPQGKFQIYISYSHVDGGSYALEIAQKLTDEFDCAVVMDESPSERPIYENNENKELLSSNLVVFVATQKAIISESIRVNDISAARHMNIPIIAVCSENVHTDRLCSLIGSPYYIQMNSNRYEEIFRKIFSALIIPPKEIEMLRGFVLNMPKDHNQTECYAAGRAYYLGRNIEEACKWFAKAAQGDSLKIKCMAGHMLGMINYIGLGIRQDFSEAYSWFTQSASFAASSFMLGYMYEVGEGKAVNYPSAVRCYTNAAELGDRDAQYILGVIYYQGSGVEKNQSLAIDWYTQSAKNGNPKAQYVLAVLYDIGSDVAQNRELAMKLYQSAAKQGHKGAMAAIRDNEDKTVYRPQKSAVKREKNTKKSNVSKIFTILSFFPGLVFLSLPFSVPGIFISFFEKQKARMCSNIICSILSLTFFVVMILFFSL